jgi:signal transduction histidine kinase
MEAMAETRTPAPRDRDQDRLFESDSVEVEVIDTGPGIDGAVIDQVFDQFFTTKPEGVGMGLAISRSIIESHGGSIRAESSRGGGAILRFTLQDHPHGNESRERADSIHS